jgi:hypothetical protein
MRDKSIRQHERAGKTTQSKEAVLERVYKGLGRGGVVGEHTVMDATYTVQSVNICGMSVGAERIRKKENGSNLSLRNESSNLLISAAERSSSDQMLDAQAQRGQGTSGGSCCNKLSPCKEGLVFLETLHNGGLHVVVSHERNELIRREGCTVASSLVIS